MDKQALAQRIKDACEGSGEDVSFYESYSGRGMYGAKCVGIVSTHQHCMKVIAQVINEMMASVSAAAQAGDIDKLSDAEADFEESVDLLMAFSKDSMGMGGVIIYWEGLEPLPPEEEHDGQPDEAQEWHDFDPDC